MNKLSNTGFSRIDANLATILIGACILWFAPSGLKSYGLYVISFWLVMSIAAMGLNLTLGYAGLKSLAQAAFLGIGAYTTALITAKGGIVGPGWSWPLAFVVSGTITFFAGVVLGFPALRVKFHYLAFVTLAFNTLLFLVLRNEEEITGGSFGLVGMPRPSFFGISTNSNLAFYYFSLACFLTAVVVMWWILRSPWGRSFKALREKLTSRVEKVRPSEIKVHYLDGPLRDLDNRWQFRPLSDQSCEIDFAVDFSFRNALFEKLAGQYFDRAFRKMVGAFEKRAEQLYGNNNSSATSAA